MMLLLTEGYYWYKVRNSRDGWKICQIKNGYVHFFGQVSQPLDSRWLADYVTFSTRNILPPESP